MYNVGTRIISIKGELDDDENGLERHTGPNAEGVITRIEHGAEKPEYIYYSVAFKNGTTVFLDDAELARPEDYTVLARPEDYTVLPTLGPVVVKPARYIAIGDYVRVPGQRGEMDYWDRVVEIKDAHNQDRHGLSLGLQNAGWASVYEFNTFVETRQMEEPA